MNLHQRTLDARSVATALGGDVAGPDSVVAPGPGHKPGDRSLSIKLDPNKPDGFTVNSFAGDDWRDCRDHVAAKLGLPAWKPQERKARRSSSGSSRQKVTEYVYKLEDGTPYLKVIREEWTEGGERKKNFPQLHWTGSGWAGGKPKGEKIPYRLPDLLAASIGPVFITEGEKDADNLARFGLTATTASEGAGKWTAELGKWFAGRIVYVLPDNDDSGRKHAHQVAQNLHGIAAEVRVVALPGLPEKGDVSDWLAADGDVEELLRLCVEAPVWTPESETAAEPSELEWFDDVEPVTSSRYLIKGLLDVGAMSLVFGPPGSAKTFFVMDLGFHVAMGRRWRGRRVLRAAVLYLAAEGGSGAANRIAALRAIYGGGNVPFALRRAGLDLLRDDADLQRICALAREVMDRFPGLPLLIVVDTLSRAIAGGDENSAGDMTALIRNLDLIREATGAHVLAVHHAGKDTAKGARGHSSLRAATDTEIELKLEGALRTASVTKQRDLPGEETFAFTLKSVQLGKDADGDDVSSCIVEPSEEDVDAPQRRRVSGKPTVALQALSEALIEHGQTVRTPNLPTCPVVTVDAWGEMCRRHGLSDSDTTEARKKAFQRAKASLIEKGFVRQFDGFVWKANGNG